MSNRLDRAQLLRLAPHLVGRARRGGVGSSRYARGLRETIRQAAADPDRRPVLISGERGLEKDNLAELIHFGSPDRQQLMLRFDGALLRADGGELFGSDDAEPPLLELLGRGALLIDKLDQVDEPLRASLLELARSGQWCSTGIDPKPQHSGGRVFFTAEAALPAFDRHCTVIRVPPLRVRRQDLGEWLRYGVRQRARKLGWPHPPQVDEAVVRRLQTYDFPNNIRELETLIYRALQQVRRQDEGSWPMLIPEDVFWTPARQQRYRFDIWRWKPQLRDWMRAPWLWNGLLFRLVSWVFVLVNLWLWLGPQDRAHNGALNLFWAWWWPLILLGFPLVGLLPLVWALLLARHLPLGMGEAGQWLSVSFGTAALPAWRADVHVIGFCQSAAVACSLLGAVALLRRQLSNSLSTWFAASALALVLAAGGRWLVAL